jgi:hypothetical protein
MVGIVGVVGVRVRCGEMKMAMEENEGKDLCACLFRREWRARGCFIQ